jgi:hypothetical protein
MSRIQMLIAVAAVATLIAPLAPVAAQQGGGANDNTFDWSGAIPAGSWLRVKNLNGPISVEQGTGSTAEVHAVKEWRRGDPSVVRFTVVKDGNNVTICALWNNATCDEHGYHSHGGRNNDNNDVSVRFVVKLPKGVRMDAGTVNGGLTIDGASAEVVAHTVNGGITASSTSGPVTASTVNGSVRVRMDALPAGNDELSYSTVNGSVTVELPSNFNGEIDMSTVNGTLRTDFPITVSGKLNPKRIRATIGNGGRLLRLKTVNGSLELRKQS